MGKSLLRMDFWVVGQEEAAACDEGGCSVENILI